MFSHNLTGIVPSAKARDVEGSGYGSWGEVNGGPNAQCSFFVVVANGEDGPPNAYLYRYTWNPNDLQK